METSNARNYFATAQDSLHRNQFGGTIVADQRQQDIPVLRIQATRERTAPPQSIAFVPTAAALNAISALLKAWHVNRTKLLPSATLQPC